MGKILVWIAFAAVLFSAWNYFGVQKIASNYKGKKKDKFESKRKKLKLARQGFYAMTALVSLASAYLLYLIFTHQFQYEYVYRYTSRELSAGLLLSTFWAGQAGSFLLWAWFIAIMGMALIKTAKKFESQAMLFLCVIQGFFLVLLIKASPFVQQAHAPVDGQGLNPLLQNFWMVIHPPVLFLGYAAAAFPVVIALAALVRKDFDEWVRLALPWSLFTSVTLGAGIILGGFWAYGTLGWGGYWGWDPVENSSLIPWLVNFAFFHGLIVEKIRGALKRTNLFLAIISFVLVLYATFLTRSGVLADFSVHSFQDLGINAFLIFFLLTPLAFGTWLFVKRFRAISAQPIELSRLNRENVLFVSMLVLLGCAILTLLGTSFPLISRIFTQPSNVNISFYNQVNLPFAIAMTFLLGITPLLKWGKTPHELLHRLFLSLVLTGFSLLVAFLKGVREPILILFTGTAAFALWTNAIVLVQQWRISWKTIGAQLAHIGVALMFIGIIVSGNFTREQMVKLSQGLPVKALGHKLIFEGTEPGADRKDILRIHVADGSSGYLATPKFYFTEYNQSMMKEPFIKSGLLQDFYISPLEKSNHVHDHATLSLRKGETRKFANYEIRFAGFDMHRHGDNGAIRIGANLEIGNGSQNFSLTPALMIMGNRRSADPVAFPIQNENYGTVPSVFLKAINASEKSIQLAFSGILDVNKDIQASKEEIVIQVSTKPFMNVLWLGTILLTVGTAISFSRRISNR